MKTYYVSAGERWRFWETSILKKDDVKISLEYNVKWGSVEVKVDDDFEFDEDFESSDFDDWFIVDTGDEEFEEATVLEGEVDIDSLLEYNTDEYYDLREALEDDGWDYVESDVYIDNIIVEEKIHEEI